jgi:hypothetical protein
MTETIPVSQVAYEAYRLLQVDADDVLPWEQLDARHRTVWLGVAMAVRGALMEYEQSSGAPS